jgi:hypothetical protein
MRMLTILILSLIVATGALAQGVSIADFEGGSNDGNWTWGNGADQVHPAGGNPDGWFGNDYINSFAPILRCENNAPGWTGDFVSMGVNRISGDFQTLAGPTYMAYYPLTFLFRNQMGTPNDIEDDIHCYPDPYFFNTYSPDVGAGWAHTEFEIPINFDGAPGELPEGWSGGSYLTGNGSFPADATWQDVMSNVDKIEIWFFHPDEFGALTWFDMGADNVMLEWQGGPVAIEDSSFGSVKALFR